MPPFSKPNRFPLPQWVSGQLHPFPSTAQELVVRSLGSTRMSPQRGKVIHPRGHLQHCGYGKNELPKKMMRPLFKGREALEATQNNQQSCSTDGYSSSFCKATVVERRNLLIVGRYGAGAFHQVLQDAARIQWAEGLGRSCLGFPIKGGNWMHLRFHCVFFSSRPSHIIDLTISWVGRTSIVI